MLAEESHGLEEYTFKSGLQELIADLLQRVNPWADHLSSHSSSEMEQKRVEREREVR